MATRRIARGRGASPVPIIILSVILVGLLGSTIVLGLKVGDLDDDIKKGVERELKLRNDATTAQAGFRSYETLVGLTLEGARTEFENLKNDMLKKAPLPAFATPENPPVVGKDTTMATLLDAYATRCAGLEKVVAQLEQELGTAKSERETATKDGELNVKAQEEQVVAEKKVSEDLRTKKAEVETTLDTVRKDLTAQVEGLKTEKTNLVKEVKALQKDVKDLKEAVKKKEERIVELLYPRKTLGPLDPTYRGETVDGKVLTVDADGKHVMVDLGRRDWVEVGMVFSVFDNADPEAQREKGQIQIREVYDDIARAKVIKQDPLDPILPGMLLVNPAFKRGRKLEFVLEGKFSQPGVEQLLGRYPCRIVNTVSRTTDYVVVGEGYRDDNTPDPMDSEKVITAKDLKIHVMKEGELLHYLGEHE